MENKVNKIILPIVIASILILTIGGVLWTKNKNANNIDSTIKIGVSAPLTGEGASWGQNALAGAELAVKEVNDKGGIKGKKVELIVEDDKAVGTEGVNIFNKLTSVDKVVGILGPVASSVAGPSLPIAQESKTPVVMIASAPHLTDIGEYIFQVFPSDAYQGKAATEFIAGQLKAKKVAMIYTNNDYGKGIAEIFKSESEKAGVEIVYEAGVDNTPDADFKTDLAKIKESKADAIFLPLYPANTITALKQAKEMGIKTPIIGTDSIDGEEVLKSGYAEGVIYAKGKTDLKNDFIEKIHALEKFKNLQVSSPALYSYDSAKIMLNAIEKAGTDKEKLQKEIAKTNYKGVSNPVIEFENGKLKNADFEVLTIKNGTAVKYAK